MAEEGKGQSPKLGRKDMTRGMGGQPHSRMQGRVF